MENFTVAYPRIRNVADPESFQPYPSARDCGVLTGFCRIGGRQAAVFSQEPTKFAGASGLMESNLICNLMDEAARRRCPIIGILHSSGAKIQEGVDSLAGYAEIFKRNVRMSGIVPQISIVLGTCAGGAVYSPALTDCIIIKADQGEMFITGPEVIRKTVGEETDRKSLGGSQVHARKSGVAHMVAKDESYAGTLVRTLLSYLPSHCEENPPVQRGGDQEERRNPDLEMLAKEDKRKAYDVGQVIRSIADRDTLLEIQPDHARNITTGLARIGGYTVGFVANNPAHLAGALDVDSSMKGARFIRFCDSFNIPVVTLVDVPGYWPGVEQEHSGIIRHGANLLYAYSEAEVPCITVVLRKAYGGAYCVMGSKQCGATVNYAWPMAEIAVMGASAAVEILFKREIAQSKDPVTFKQGKTDEYVRQYVNLDLALRQNYIDKVIQPSQTRNEILKALKSSLRNYKPGFKHKNIPL